MAWKSYYSTKPDEHAAITGRPSYRRTSDNIAEAVRRSIPLRAGVIGAREDQDVTGAVDELCALGVAEDQIRVDRLRQVGRGVRDRKPDVDQLCGHCTDGVVAIGADGTVQPCVFTRWPEMTVGNLQEQSMRNILNGERFATVWTQLADTFAQRQESSPAACQPPCPPTRGACPPRCAPPRLPKTVPGRPDEYQKPSTPDRKRGKASV